MGPLVYKMHVIKTLPSKIAVAVSGGIDSIVTLHWLNKRRDVLAVHYIHDSEYANEEFEFVKKLCTDIGVDLLSQQQPITDRKNLSQEEYWRNGRYEFFKGIPLPVCTGHTLDDAVESYLFTAMHGQGKYMEYSHANVVRPFITTRKSELVEYASKNKLSFLEDPSNSDINFAARNRIRHCIIPEALKINPGLHNMVKRRIIEKLNSNCNAILNTANAIPNQNHC